MASLRHCIALVSLAGTLGCGSGGAGDPDAGPPDAPVVVPTAFDVIVVGAGAGGIGAAIQAARLGRTVLVIEPSLHVGGQMLTVSAMDESGPDRVEGIYAEFTQRVVTRYATLYNGKPVGTCSWSDTSMCFEPQDGETVLRDMLIEAGVQLETGIDVVSVRFAAPDQVSGVNTSDGRAWASRIVIDGTEYGDILPLAGAAYRIGNGVIDDGQPEPGPDACVQTSTYTLAIASYPGGLPPALDLTGGGPPGADYETFAPIWRLSIQDLPVQDCSGPAWSWGCHNAYRGTPDRAGANYVATDFAHTKTTINALNDYPTVASIPDVGLLSGLWRGQRIIVFPRRQHELALAYSCLTYVAGSVVDVNERTSGRRELSFGRPRVPEDVLNPAAGTHRCWFARRMR